MWLFVPYDVCDALVCMHSISGDVERKNYIDNLAKKLLFVFFYLITLLFWYEKINNTNKRALYTFGGFALFFSRKADF